MANLFLIIIIITCLVLSFFILIQKPKGGGLSGTFGTLGTQVMGVKQSGDVMAKGTWYSIIIIAGLSIAIVFQLPISKQNPTPVQEEQPAQAQPVQQPAAAPAPVAQ